jgi:hypothetical protein
MVFIYISQEFHNTVFAVSHRLGNTLQDYWTSGGNNHSEILIDTLMHYIFHEG